MSTVSLTDCITWQENILFWLLIKVAIFLLNDDTWTFSLYQFAELCHTHTENYYTIVKNLICIESEKWKWRDMWPSIVTHTRNLCSAFNPFKVHTHSSKHTHTVNTHLEQWAAFYAAAPGGAVAGSVPCSRAPQSWYWGWREHCTFIPPTYNSCRTWDSNSQPLG